ncbi:putative prophage protein [Escherichia coli]|uniref:Putative prophage protein n=5 Tax=Escherichia TaxID=561 RepID=A0A376MAG1_ECOLX|nr:putative prophage protein [Escherichia coli]
MRIHQNNLTNISAENMNQGRQMAIIHRDRTQAKYKALDMTELSLKVAIRTIDRHVGEGYAKEHPDLISAFMTTAAANFATLTEREIAEAEQVTTINVKTGEVES